ncbi:sporulation transcriptional regulator SpoIIID [Enterobacter bugandensis]|uniref:sporulation transcriptional regulator SpoIIID n=1 Tax=Enterobacter bugandensis TaxID=881260 RepID=UPI002003BC00|nr:sporulation transcriptional regulator SpoIIID [Enterobacter bugandensis]MCK7198567.1 sporulation transcriptional regulator SpoIIID [Enterobacter bugandensis]
MSEQEQRYDRLASRLAILVSRLFIGETLSIRQLAQEFGVSERTVQRDLRERLRYIDTEYSGGNFRLRDARGPFRTNSDIIRFARITRVAHYFPALDPKLLSVLLDSGQDSPCIIWNAPPRQALAVFRSLSRPSSAVAVFIFCTTDTISPPLHLTGLSVWKASGT